MLPPYLHTHMREDTGFKHPFAHPGHSIGIPCILGIVGILSIAEGKTLDPHLRPHMRGDTQSTGSKQTLVQYTSGAFLIGHSSVFWASLAS